MLPSKVSIGRPFSTVGAVFLFSVTGMAVITLEAMDPCTMGGDGLVPVFILALPMSAITLGLIYVSGRVTGTPNPVRLAILPIAILFLVYLGPVFWGVTVLGNHNCGPDMNHYLSGSFAPSRLVPIGYLLLLGISVLLTARPYFRASAA